ncbi:hypothetical protein ACFYW1_37400, partial [Streptomyces sp. NPDC002669]|uniref:hypothetical protein n=1 Tax=Streptomyces sp. NPDC002669 TaxID=3364658 RepID=UPI00367E97C1
MPAGAGQGKGKELVESVFAERQKTISTVAENSESGPETEREKVLVESEGPERENAEAEDL